MLATASIDNEVTEYLAQYAHQLDTDGKRLVVLVSDHMAPHGLAFHHRSDLSGSCLPTRSTCSGNLPGADPHAGRCGGRGLKTPGYPLRGFKAVGVQAFYHYQSMLATVVRGGSSF